MAARRQASTMIMAPESPAPEQQQKYCYMNISIAGSEPRTVVFHLNTKQCPKTCNNFASLCSSTAVAQRPTTSKSHPSSSTKGSSTTKPIPTYRGTEFHRIKPGFMVQGGDYENFDGTGGASIYDGATFPDESFATKHDAEGILSMANRGPNTNGSQFFITLGGRQAASHLDGRHVAFGRVVDGIEVVREMARVEVDERDRPTPMQRIVVVDCGVGKGRDEDGDNDGNDVDDEKKRRRKKKHRRRDMSLSPSLSSGQSSSDDNSRSRSRHNKRRKRSRSRDRKEKKRRKKHKSKSRHRDRDNDEDRKRSRKHSSSRSRKHRKRSRSRSR